MRPCGDADPLRLSSDPDVRAVMATLSINPAQVTFHGCESGRFATFEEFTSGITTKYTVTYSDKNPRTYLAPITHELAHIFQMESAGGREKLAAALNRESKRIELGADYLAGIIYGGLLENTGRATANEFQNSIDVGGLYYESVMTAHGTPSQRTAAFRLGLIAGPSITDLHAANAHFQEDEYGQVLQQ